MSQRDPSRRANLLLAAISTLLALIVGVGAGEALVRHRERTRSTPPSIMPTLYYRHRSLRYALVRHGNYFDWVHVDGEGFRGPEVALTKPPGVTRIMVVGSSTTFDVGVSRDERAWPARLAYWLGRQDAGRRYEVINAGVPGYTMADQVARLQTELYRYRPDLLILYEGHNDLLAGLRGRGSGPAGGANPDRPDEDVPQTPWLRWVDAHSLLYGKVVGALDTWHFKGESDRRRAGVEATTPKRLAAFSADFGRNVGLFVSSAHELGIPVALAELEHVSGAGALTEADPALRRDWGDYMAFTTPETMLQGYARANQVLHDVSSRLHVPVIATEGFGLRGLQYFAPGDPIHFDDQGADLMGREMAKAILAGHLLPAEPAAAPRLAAR